MNRATTVLTVLLVGGYLAFEATHIYRFSHRMEPAYILDEFVVADRAVELCGDVAADKRSRFLKNLDIVRRRALAELETAPDPGTEGPHAQEALVERVRQKEAEVEQHVAEHGCSDSQVWRWLKLHEIRGRLRVVDTTKS
ncbi:MAG: hypothetical protein AAGG11_20135 [Pseudomonadota bacterium]